MKQLLIWASSFLLAGIIISPFFWLKFLKKRSRWGYVFWSSAGTTCIFLFGLFWLYDIVLKRVSTIDALEYFDGISMGAIYLVVFISIISPFFFTKIIYEKISVKSFFISLFLSTLIFVIYAWVFVFILLPKAFMEFNRRL